MSAGEWFVKETMVLTAPPRAQGALAAALPAYEIGEELGRGGYGVVVAAEHRQLRRQVAIKQLAATREADAEVRARFLLEARLLASLDHPHIVSVYDFVEAGGMYLLVMERLTGGTVAQRLRFGGSIGRAACAVVLATCEALDYAHARQVLHRDIKPENLMFSGAGVLKVTDFGIAKLLGGATGVATATGAMMGTPSYMAPEQIIGGQLTAATDVYAVGVLLYELLSGALPFRQDANALAAGYRQLDEPPIPLLAQAPDTPRALGEVVDRALQRDPAHRYATARQLGVAVRNAAVEVWGPEWQTTAGIAVRSPPATTGGLRALPQTLQRSRDRRGSVPPLLEREGELAALEDALGDAVAGYGSVVVMTAAAGMGKTRLAQEAARAAAARGMLALSARGVELERSFPYGVIRQLFEPALIGSSSVAREALLGGAAGLAGTLLLGDGEPTSPVGEAAIDHALYWLLANLAARGPVALVIDDAHWADRPSLRALLHIVVRVDGLPVAVVVATRPSEPLAEQDVLDQLADDPASRSIHLAPLSEAAVATLLRDRLSEADDEFVHACRTASAGNPYLIAELTLALADAGVALTADNVPRVGTISPRTVAHRVQARLRGLPPEMSAVARALAIMGGAATVVDVARAAGLGEELAGRAADRLAEIEILAPGRPLEFAHPIVRAAAYESMSVSERSAGHAAAARMAHADGAAPETVANHLLHTDPARDAWVADRLREAARSAAGVGALGATVVYLQRALQEPPSTEQRAEILLELSEGHRHQNAWEEASSELRQALREAGDTRLRVEIARRLFSQLMIARRHAEAALELAPLLGELGESEPGLALDLELAMSTSMCLDDDQAPQIAARVLALPVPGGGGDSRERIVLSRQAWALMGAGGPAQDAVTRARGALRSGELIAEDARAYGFEMSVMTLALADRFTEAHEHLERAMAASRARGHLGRWAFLSGAAAQVFLLQGRLLDAEQHALQALGTLRPDGIAFPAALDALIAILLERGQPAAAWHTHEHLADSCPLPDPLLFAGLRLAPARLLIATGEVHAGLQSLLAIGQRQLALGRPNPAWCAWRSAAARVHLQLGERKAAIQLAAEELEVARNFGTARALGVALRAAGFCHGGRRGQALLTEAVETLEGSGADLELAHALVELGMTARRDGQAAKAVRAPLRRGHEIAVRLGALALAARACQELRASGARAPRATLPRVHSLTPSERRICQLAGRGLTKQQIAEAFFVTAKTVDERLAASYRKLGVTRPHELAAAMAE